MAKLLDGNLLKKTILKLYEIVYVMRMAMNYFGSIEFKL